MLKKVFNAIMGVYAIFGALYCMFWPDDSFLNAGWIVAVLLAFLGICAIAAFVFDKKDGKESGKASMLGGIGSLILGACAVVISILSMLIPEIAGLFLLVVVIIFTVWLFYSGISGIVKAVGKKNEAQSRWGLLLGLGIAEVLFGIIGVLDYFVFGAENASIYIGVMLLVFGICLLLSVFEKDKADA